MHCYRSILFCFLLVSVCYTTVTAQALSIGDTLPDVRFNSVFRYAEPSVQLSDFRGKVLILDLWRTTCSHCMSSFTHFDSLAKMFPGRVTALAVTTETREAIGAFISGNAYVKATRLPVVTDDSVLAGKRFPFIYIPHVVVVDGDGRIAAITGPEKVTDEVIGELLAGKAVHLPLKKELADFDYDIPVLTEGKGRNLPDLAYSSTLMHRLPGVLQLGDVDSSGDRIFYKAYNMTIPDLYAQAFHFFLTPNRLVLKVKDSSRFIISPMADAAEQTATLWVYNLILPKPNPKPGTYAAQDFDRFFGTHGYIEKRQVKCLALVRTGTGQRWLSKGEAGYFTDSAGLMLIHNITLANVCSSWNMSFALPVVNETGIENEQADMVLRGSASDLALLRQSLRHYDLDLVPVTRALDVLVIEER